MRRVEYNLASRAHNGNPDPPRLLAGVLEQVASDSVRAQRVSSVFLHRLVDTAMANVDAAMEKVDAAIAVSISNQQQQQHQQPLLLAACGTGTGTKRPEPLLRLQQQEEEAGSEMRKLDDAARTRTS
jgi:hypothetical protein|eukprot:COSAG01_NODE_16523_length_1229_cov_4.148343_2_plen_127_part_00